MLYSGCLQILLRKGASRREIDAHGRTPFDVIGTDKSLDDPLKDDDIDVLEDLLRP